MTQESKKKTSFIIYESFYEPIKSLSDEKINTENNGFEIRVYDIDFSNQDDVNKLENYIISKVRKMKIHNGISTYSNINGIKKDFLNKIKEAEDNNKSELSKICTPEENKKKWFDARRSRVTEFMSQLLLERELNCIFFEETDKRINLSAFEADTHVKGVDVTGIHTDSNGSNKFVICEVKASGSSDIPCSSSGELFKDIKNSYNLTNKRVFREIKDFTSKLIEADYSNDISSIIEYITDLYAQILDKKSSKNLILDNILFIPFLIRRNPKIIENNDIGDFNNFNKDDFEQINLKGVIWVLNQDIDTFCIDLYNKAVLNEQ